MKIAVKGGAGGLNDSRVNTLILLVCCKGNSHEMSFCVFSEQLSNQHRSFEAVQTFVHANLANQVGLGCTA